MSLPLKINVARTNTSKTLRFGPTMSVSEACRQIKDKIGEGGEDHGLYQKADPAGKTPARWLRPDRTLQFYDLKANDELDYKKKHRPAKVRLLDGTNKTVLIDDSSTVGETILLIGQKIKLSAPEEFGIQTERVSGQWLKSAQTLHEQGVTDDDTLVLKKRFFVTDDAVGKEDPVQLHLVYVQAREQVIDGTHSCTMDEAVQFAAMQCQVDLGNFNAAIHKPGFLKLPSFFPMHMLGKKDKPEEIEKKILGEYKKLVGTTEIAAKYRYVQLCRSLKTYGITFFPCRQTKPGAKKPTDLLFGISRNSIMLCEPTTKEPLKTWKVEWMKRWAASGQSLTLDLGEHEEEFIVINTEFSDGISQTIAGYIDILFKRSKDQGVYVDDDDAETGNVEAMGRIRGQAAMGFTSSVTGGHQAMHGKVAVGAAQSRALMIRKGQGQSQQIEITDIPTAIAHISERLEAIPKEFSRSTSSLTPKQWSEQLNTNFGALSAAAAKLKDYVNGGSSLDRNQMNNYAREIAMAVGNMLSSARNASQGQPEDDMPLFDAAKAVSEAIKNLLQASQDLAASPNDPVKREQWKNAQEALITAGIRLESAQKGALIDDGAKRLLLESARAVAAATENLCAEAEGAAAGLNGPARDKVLQAVKMLQSAGLATNQVAEILAPVMLGPEAKQNVEFSAAALKKMAAALLAAAREGGIDPGAMESLGRAAQLVNDALTQLLTASLTAEERLDPEEREFANAANDILHGTAVMLSAKGKPQVMKDQAQKILAASGRLIQATKKHAANAPDEATRNRLMACAKRVADATRQLMTDANNAAQNPGDEPAWLELANSSRQVGEATRLLIGDASKETALKALRTNAKKAAADTTGLLTAVQIAAASIKGTPEEQNLLNAARAAAEALKNLINSTAHAAQHPDDIAANQKLTEDAKQIGPAVFGLVNAAKQAVPRMTDDTKKNNLVVAANNAGTSVKTMLESMSRVLAVAGVAEIEQALEVFDATGATIESALMFAETSGLQPTPGTTRDSALEALNAGVKSLAAATKDIATLKDNPGQLGPAAKQLATSVQMTVEASRDVAANTPSRAAQKQILASAKHLNAEGTKLAKAARAVVENPADNDLFNVLSRAVKDTADALQALIGASKGAEPGAREIEQALRTLKEEVAKLSKDGQRGDFKAAADELVSISKALAAATQHLAGTARNNPPGLGAAANAIKQTIPPLVATANKAAASAPDAPQTNQILSSVGGLAQNLGTLLTAARAAGAKNDDQQIQAQVAEANRAVAASIKKVQDAVSNATPAQREVTSAVELATDATRSLNVAGTAPSRGKEYEGLIASSKALAAATATVVKLSTGGGSDDQTAAASADTAKKLEALVQFAKAATAKASADGEDALSASAAHIRHAAQSLKAAASQPPSPETRNHIIEAAKEMAAHTSTLVGSARQQANDIKDSNPQAYQGMVLAGKAIAEKTAALVEAAKASAAGQPGGRERMGESSTGLLQAIDQLLAARPSGASGGVFNPDSLSPDSEQLVNSTKSVGAATNQLLQVTSDIIYGKKTPQQAQPQIAAAAKAVTNSLMALNNSANYLKPGAKDLEYAVGQAQTASQQLQDASLNAAIGLLANTAPPGTTYQDMQESMVAVAKETAAAVKDFVLATRGSPEEVGAAARRVGDCMARLQQTAEQASGTITDQQRQQEGLDQAKTITDAVLGILEATKAGDAKALGAQAKSTSDAIQGFLEYLKGGVMGMREVDEAIGKIGNDSRRLQADLGSIPKNPNYNQCQDNLQNQAKNLAATLNNLTKIAKTTPDQLGAAASQVAAAIPPLIRGALETAASTPEESAKQPLLNSTRNIAEGTADLIRQGKLLAADPSNAMHANNMSKAFGQVTGNIRDFIKAVKEGNVGEAMINQASEAILKTLSQLDQSSLYAAAGQLEADSESAAQGEKALGDAVIAVAKQMAGAATAVVKARQGTSDQAGSAAQSLAKVVGELAGAVTAMASLSADPERQQASLAAAREVGEASESLLRLCKENAEQQALAQQTTQISESLKKLVTSVQSANAETSRGLAELEKAKNTIKAGLTAFVDPSKPGKAGAKTDDVVETAKAIADATSSMVAAAASGTAEELVAAALSASGATVALMENSKTATKQDGAKPDVVDKVNSGVESVANSMMRFLDAARAQKEKPSPDNQRKLSEFAGSVVDRINEVVEAASQLPGGANAETIFRGGDDLEEMAERELLNAASIIEEAAKALLKAKKRRLKRADVEIKGDDLVGAVLAAAEAIAAATGNLVRAATVVQKELVASGRTTKDKVSVYKKDPAWAKGLISAAKSVAGSVQILVTAANNAAQGTSNESELIAAARGVAAATARLVSASRTKADPLSPSLANLSNCAKAVASSTAQLVQAAKDANQQDAKEDQTDYSALSAMQKKRLEMEQMSSLEALQKQLQEQEKLLKDFHRRDYAAARRGNQ